MLGTMWSTLECRVNSDLAANGRALDREHHKTGRLAMLHLKETFQTYIKII